MLGGAAMILSDLCTACESCAPLNHISVFPKGPSTTSAQYEV